MNAIVRGLLAAALGAAMFGVAQADVNVDIALGHGGRWIGECLTPVSVTLRNDGQDAAAVRLSLAKAQVLGSAPLQQERAVFLGAGSTRREWFLVPAPDAYSASLALTVTTEPQVPVHHRGDTASRGRMTIDLQGEQPLADASLPNAGRVIGVIGDDRSVLPSLLPNAARKKLVDLSGNLAVVAATSIDPESLVLAPFSLEGFDAVVLVDPGSDVLGDPVMLDGVLDWVALGGQLVVSPGANSGTLGTSPLAPFLPARSGAPESVDMRDPIAGLLTASDETAEREPQRFDGTWLPLSDRSHGGLYADHDLGAGRIRLLAFDARAALRACTDVAHYIVIADVLSGRTAPVRDAALAEAIGQFRFAAGADLEQSVTEVMRRDAFAAPPLILVLAALALYVLVVGPIDWIVLRRLGKQRLTTFTFGGAVLLFTALAYGASFLVFASGAVVNRLVFVDLVDAGREGRQLIRIHDIVGYYSPRGADRSFSYGLPAAVAGSALPGGGTSEVGTAQPLIVSGPDAVSPEVLLQVAFRSQRVVRTVLSGTTGRTIETEWIHVESSAHPRLRLINGLSVALDRVDVLMPAGRGRYHFEYVAAGGEATADFKADMSGALGSWWTEGGQSLSRGYDAAQVAHFQAFLSRTSAYGIDGRALRSDVAQPVSLDRQVLLARTGMARGGSLYRGRALLLAAADESPVPLPADDDDGHTHVLIRKEIELP